MRKRGFGRCRGWGWCWAAIAIATGCTSETSGPDGALTKDEARARGGKADDGTDYCDLFGWYGDEICDDFCARPDPDCGGGGGGQCGGLLGLTCADGEWCDYDGASCGAADQLGTCTPRPEACIEIYSPVCGCDGSTYGNECEANAAGVDVASEGACGGGATCGGFAGLGCPGGRYCNYPDASMCGAGDQTGTCEDRPEACTALYDPACGCDGHTYSNACMAASAGVDVAYDGECAATSDCRSTGCDRGEYCSLCFGRYQCIPDGAFC